jgi:long-chain acyl-CoA synthetase
VLEENFVQHILNSIKNNWDLTALSDFEGLTYKYSEVAEKIALIHSIFRKSRVKRGDKVALLGKNCSNWAITYVATVSYGAVIVPILSDFHADDIHYIIRHSDSVFLFVGSSNYENLDKSKLEDLDAVFSLNDFSLISSKKKYIQQIFEKKGHASLDAGDVPVSRDNFTFEEVTNSELAAIVYTSGTTSFSKGVMLNLNCLMANIRYAMDNLRLTSGKKIVSFLPLAHAYGCAFEFLYPFILGCHITFLSRIPSPKILIEAFQKIHPDLVLSVPLIMEKIYRKQLKPVLNKPVMKLLLKLPFISSLLYKKICKKLTNVFGGNFFEIVIGGAALNREVEEFLTKIGFRFTVGYGMTECGPLISYSHWDVTRVGSVGKVIDTLEIKIASEDPSTIVGEIMVKGENIMNGYYKNEAATKETIEGDGWMHTGDLGLIDEEGFVYIKGRSKSMILGPSGQNIYPEEIESKINNLPFVQESLVIEKNDKLFALVYPDLEAVEAKDLDEQALAREMEKNRALINSKLPVYCAINRIELYPREFEKTPSKKIKRFLYTIISESK